jgi:hypothetical protein
MMLTAMVLHVICGRYAQAIHISGHNQHAAHALRHGMQLKSKDIMYFCGTASSMMHGIANSKSQQATIPPHASTDLQKR